MKYIVIILVGVVIMHDISLYRLHRKVEAMQTFFDEVIKRLEKYANEHGYEKRSE